MEQNAISTKEAKMLRDFKQPKREYIKSNKIVLISVAVFLILGMIIWAVFGLHTNFEINGYNEFYVQVNAEQVKEYSSFNNKIRKVVNSYGGDFEDIQVFDQGDNTKYVVRYNKNLDNDTQIKINKELAEKLEIDIVKIGEHAHVGSIMKSSDVIYTITAILILVVLSTLFAYIRYNGASAIAIIVSCLLGTMGFVSVGAMLRLSVGMSYFAMLVALNFVIVLFNLNLFETIKSSSWLRADDYATAISEGMKASRLKMCVVSLAIMVFGLLFVLITPNMAKYLSLNILFMAVVALACGLYVIPFVWSLFITDCKKREVKVKVTDNNTIEK